MFEATYLSSREQARALLHGPSASQCLGRAVREHGARETASHKEDAMRQSPLRSILVATDLGDHSDEIVRSAAALAARTGAVLHVLHALDLDAPPYGLEREGPIRSFPERTERAERALDEQLRRVVPSGSIPIERRVINYVAHRAIIETAADVSADLVVFGPHQGGEVGARFLGTTADRVLRTAEVPSLVVRGRLSLPLRRIGVPVDFSDPSHHALDLALRWSSYLGGADGAEAAALPEIRVFHVPWTAEGADDPSVVQEVIRPQMEREVEAALERSGAAAEPVVQMDARWAISPAAGITDYATEHLLGLLVMGTHGYGGLKRFLIGSVASAVARQAPCPVLLVPPERF
jgi:universal stress protein E